VSVVVPTRDRPALLERCLAALATQEGVGLELVVVDDGSVDANAVERIVEAHSGMLVRLGGRGPAAARNAGVGAATREVVLFTDDDCIAEPTWAEALSRAAAGRDALLAGRTVFDSRRPLLAASETIVMHVERRDGFATTRNVAIPRAAAAAFPFDERFTDAGGEDREWCRRLTHAGLPLVRVDDAVLRHEPDLDLPGFWRQHARYGRAARVDENRVRGGIRDHVGVIGAGMALGPRVGALVLVAQLAAFAGYARSSRP
jgi:glycosyltransferase involved in cell wall biosynthesis